MGREQKKSTKVRYIGEDSPEYIYGKIYTVLGYDSFLDGYGIMSELGEAYVVPKEYLEEFCEEDALAEKRRHEFEMESRAYAAATGIEDDWK